MTFNESRSAITIHVNCKCTVHCNSYSSLNLSHNIESSCHENKDTLIKKNQVRLLVAFADIKKKKNKKKNKEISR